jgi:hypothetical protein
MNRLIMLLKGLRTSLIKKIMSIVPDHTKRAMFIASYIAQSYQFKYGSDASVDSETLSKLNKVMKLCGDDNLGFMQVPDALSKVVMKGVVVYDVQQAVAEVDAKAQATVITQQVSDWWKYDNIEKDAETLFKTLPAVVS